MKPTETLPKYKQIIDYIQQKIDSGELKPEDRLPTEAELMHQFDVSKIVVSNALTRMALDQKVYRIPGKGTFVSARSTVPAKQSTHRRRRIALIQPDLGSSYSIQLTNHVLAVAASRDLICTQFPPTHGSPQEENAVIDMVMEMEMDGLLFFPCNEGIYSQGLLRLIDQKFPLVLLDRTLSGFDLSCVQTDNRLAGRLATERLTEQGHSRIAFLSYGPMELLPILHRFNGYMEEMSRCGFPVNPDWVITNLENNEKGREQLLRLVKNREVSAFFCVGGPVDVFLSEALQKEGLSCPKDVAAISIDRLKSNYTHYTQDTRSLASHAFDLLLRQIEEGPQPPEHILVPPIFSD